MKNITLTWCQSVAITKDHDNFAFTSLLEQGFKNLLCVLIHKIQLVNIIQASILVDIIQASILVNIIQVSICMHQVEDDYYRINKYNCFTFKFF